MNTKTCKPVCIKIIYNTNAFNREYLMFKICTVKWVNVFYILCATDNKIDWQEYGKHIRLTKRQKRLYEDLIVSEDELYHRNELYNNYIICASNELIDTSQQSIYIKRLTKNTTKYMRYFALDCHNNDQIKTMEFDLRKNVMYCDNKTFNIPLIAEKHQELDQEEQQEIEQQEIEQQEIEQQEIEQQEVQQEVQPQPNVWVLRQRYQNDVVDKLLDLIRMQAERLEKCEIELEKYKRMFALNSNLVTWPFNNPTFM